MDSVDDEWLSFVQSQNNGFVMSIGNESIATKSSLQVKPHKKLSEYFADDINYDTSDEAELHIPENKKEFIPVSKESLNNIELYISTKTKVLFLNQKIDIYRVFWEIPIIEYWRPELGVVKKQMKVVSKTPEEYEELTERLKTVPYYIENVIKQINNPTSRRIKFKDERKITVGISKKDIMNCRSKAKNAFYNCFAMILRFKHEGIFKEIHIKVFNTGKLEIPGVLNSDILETVKGMILDILKPHLEIPLTFAESSEDENVLINSNFNCGFFINREKLHAILRGEKYGIETSYDSCIYPGIKCKFYFNNEIGFDKELQRGKIDKEDKKMKISELGENNKYTEVSLMIFRTGSCLIVGNCSEKTLRFIFEFIKNILIEEYSEIVVRTEQPSTKGKKQKIRKRTVNITKQYFTESITSTDA